MTDKVGRLAGGARKIASASELARAILRSPPPAAFHAALLPLLCASLLYRTIIFPFFHLTLSPYKKVLGFGVFSLKRPQVKKLNSPINCNMSRQNCSGQYDR